jgi:HEAT repeat protein
MGVNGASAVPELLAMAQSDVDLRARWMAIRAIGWIGSGACAVTSEILALASDQSAEVRADAVHAIGSLGTACARSRWTAAILDTLHARLQDEEWYVRRGALEALARFQDLSTHLIADGLRSADDTLAARAAQLLGQGRGSRVTWSALRAALGDSREYVRREVADAIGGLGAAMRSGLIIAQRSDSASVREGASWAIQFLDYATSSPVAGRCFRLALSPWQEPLALGEDTVFTTLPAFVRFSTVKYERRTVDESPSLRVEPALGHSYSIHGPGAWLPQADSSEVIWSTGFSGVTMKLGVVNDSLRGVARTFWDFPRDGQTSRVLGIPVHCAAP